MRIATFPAGAFRTNCYIVSSDDSNECMIIDPGQDAAPQVCDIIDTNKLHPAGIYLTHGHADHVWNTPELSEKYDIPVVVHHDDMFMLKDPAVGVGAGLSSVFPFNGWKPPRLLTTYQDNELLIGGLSVTVLSLPGHTPGGVGLLVTDTSTDSSAPTVLFSGDTLFKGAVGRTDLCGGDAQTLLASIERELIPLPGDVVVAPGHGATSTMAAERADNVYLRRFR